MAGHLPHIVYPVMKRLIGALVSVLVIALALSPPAFAKKPPVGDMAPDFTLATNGKYNLRLSEQRGYIHVIVFWASWCRSCPLQLDSLNALKKKYADYGVNVWAITLDKTRNAADHYLMHKQLDFTILYDTSFEVSERYDIDDLPSSLIVDRDGRIRHIQDGFEPTHIDEYDAILQKLVRE